MKLLIDCQSIKLVDQPNHIFLFKSFFPSIIYQSSLVYCKSVNMVVLLETHTTTPYTINTHQNHITSKDQTYLLGLLDKMDSEDRDYNEIDKYINLQDLTHSSIDVNIQDKTTDHQDISLKHKYILFGHAPSLWHSSE